MESESRIEESPASNLSIVPSSVAEFNLHEFTKRVNQYQAEQQSYDTASRAKIEIHIEPSETYLTDVAIWAKF